MTKPNQGEYWQHKNGQVYEVLYVTNTKHPNPAYPSDVVYQGTNGAVWSRRLSAWDKSFTRWPKEAFVGSESDA